MCTEICTRKRDRRGHPADESAWCPECREDHERHVEEQGHLADLAIESKRLDAFLHATDEEWRARLDDLAPRVLDLTARRAG